MARTKGSKNGVLKPKKTSNKAVEPYKFRNKEKVIYHTGLFGDYKDQIATVTRCYLEKRFYKWYMIEFEDGRKMPVKEDWIMGINEVAEVTEVSNEDKIGDELW